MSELVFFGTIGLLFTALLGWGFRVLPKERWQMLAVLPLHKHQENSWHGTNLTYYGFFIATSQLFAISLMLLLLGSLSISFKGTALTTAILLGICLPASRIVATLVEKKHHTFTIGGASCIGILLAPWTVLGSSHLLSLIGTPVNMPVLPMLAALSISYTLGEGLGRLGCISFGCCYGKPVAQCSLTLQKLFDRFSFNFSGSHHKAVYEGRLGGQRLVPIQAVTAAIYTFTALLGSFLFLHGRYVWALLLSIVVSQGWRILSETLRADFRGFTKISAYQKMGLAAMIYMGVLALILPNQAIPVPSLERGITALWHPGVILGLQFVWLIFFVYFGRSTITTSEVKFDLLHERI